MTPRSPRPRTPSIEPLGPHHDRAAFSSGVSALDRYLRQQASQDLARRAAAVFVLTEPSAPAVRGYYTLSAASILLAELPEAIAKRLPKYPHVPVTLLGRLAVDAEAQGRGYGELLLMDALRKSLSASRTVASTAVVVDAKDAAARRFYERYQFILLPESGRRLFLPMRVIAALELPE